MQSDEPRRRVAADEIRDLHARLAEALTRQPPEATVSVEITDAAKSEVRVVTKVHAPVGADLAALEAHAKATVALTAAAHSANTARKGPSE